MVQSTGEVEAELATWYSARQAAAGGRSLTIQTSAGLRTLIRQDLPEINNMIEKLERQIKSANKKPFLLANFRC